MAYDSTFIALADPTRRQVFEMLARGGPQPVGRLAAQLPVSRPAVSQHLAVLAEAGLVKATPQGARRIYTADPAGLASLREWIDGMWDDVLSAFAKEIRKEGN